MDSFFAAADNLDNLLDELEESEEVENVPSLQKSAPTLEEKAENVDNDIHGASLSEKIPDGNFEIRHEFEAGATNNLSEVNCSGPGFPTQQELQTRNISELPLNGSTSPVNNADNIRQCYGNITPLGGHSGEAILVNGNDEAPQFPEAEIENLPNSPKTINGVPGPENSNVHGVLENSDEDKPSQSTSELLMEIFGAVPGPKADCSEEQALPAALFSPLNPFSDAYNEFEQESVSQTPNEANVPNLEDTNTGPILNQTNPFYNIASNSLSSNVVEGEGLENTSTADAEHVTYTFLNSQPTVGLPGPEDSVVESALGAAAAVGNEIVNGSGLNLLHDTATTEIGPLPPAAEGTSKSENQAHGVATSQKSSTSPVFLKDDAAVGSPSPEKQERSSTGFMKDVAVSQEEFDRFWEEMEMKEDADSNALPAEEGINHQDNLPSQIHPDSESASTKESNTGGQWDIAVLDDPTSMGEDVVIISSVPQDTLVSESGFEQFMESEMRESIPEVSVTPVTPTQPAPETSPVSIPVITTPGTHDGSPVFPLHVPAQDITQASSADNQGAEQSESNNRLSLNMSDLPGHETEATENARYPATPPPPYTEEMHANYERSLSPTQQIDSPSQQVPEQAQHGTEEGEHVVDDFSVLPTSILDSITRPGDTKPTWVPDQDAPQCNNCAQKFTFTRRRHHCRACGRVFCASCCKERAPLKYMEYKEARVCAMCSLAIKQADALALMSQKAAQNRSHATVTRPPQNADAVVEAGADIVMASAEDPPQQGLEAMEESQTPSAEVSPNQEMTQSQGGPSTSFVTEEDMEVEGAMARAPSAKSVRFSDGTRPTHPDGVPTTPPPPSRVNRVRKKHNQLKDPASPEAPDLPPVIIAHGENGAYAVQENPDANVVMGLLESEEQNPQSFVLNPNLIVHIKFVTHAGHHCWCYWSEGMDSVGQREVVLVLEREGLGDREISKDAFSFYTCIFERARKGKIFNTTDFMPRTMLGVEDSEEIFGLTENAGFLFVQATSQSLDGLACLKRKVMHFADGYGNAENTNLPIRSMLFALLVQKNEAPWATLFPMRLMLRLGVESQHYPCPIFSIRRRAPVYHELGHTILAILCDFRNFKYRVVSVPGLRVVVSSCGSVGVQIPCNRFADTIRIMNSSNESVLAIGTGTFGPKILPQEEEMSSGGGPCDSHLVCVQDQQTSSYHTEIMSMKGTRAINTGAAFVIFNGSLKSDGTHVAKCAIVEDGIMIQLLPEKMEELRASLKSMEDFKVLLAPNAQDSVDTSSSSAEPPTLQVKWVDDDVAFNIGMFSPIDGTPFEGVVGFNVQGRSEQRGRKHTLRWNQVFFLASTSNPPDMSRLAEQVANGCFLALTPVLHELVKHRQHKVAVRVTIHPENVGYVAGSGLHDLPLACMNALDEQLIQTIHNAANSVAVEQEAVIIELLFSILLSRPAYRMA